MLEENYDKGHAVHRVAYEALQDSIRHDECEDLDVDKAQEETKKKSKQDYPKTLPGSPPSPPPPPQPPIREIKPPITMIPDDLYMDDETTADEQAYSSGEEVGRDHIPIVLDYTDKDSTLTDSLLKETAEPSELTCVS
ncbi:hypothetical protein Tco_0175960 [Tanacetum coccineum]